MKILRLQNLAIKYMDDRYEFDLKANLEQYPLQHDPQGCQESQLCHRYIRILL